MGYGAPEMRESTPLQEHGEAPRRKGAGVWLARLGRSLSSPDRRESAPLLIAFGLCGGCAHYFTALREPGWEWLLGALAGAALAHLIARRIWFLPFLSLLTLPLLAAGVGASVSKWQSERAASPAIAERGQPVMLEGWVRAIEPGANGPRLRIRVQAISGRAPSRTPQEVRVTHANSLNVAPGRFVRCRAVLMPPPGPSIAGDYDFRRQAWFEQLGAVGYVQGRCRGGALGRPPGLFAKADLMIGAWRRQLAVHVNDAAGPSAGGFAAALMSGDRSFMAPEDAEALRGSGLAHLLAISGLHMAIVGGLVYLIVRRGLALVEPLALRVPVQKPAAAVALIASASYLVISGASISTQRAFIMAAIFFTAILIDRKALSLRSFAIAMIAVLLLHPQSAVTPGFQMSFAATGALIAVYEAWSRRRSETGRTGGHGFVFAAQSLFVTSVVGAAATAPYALYHFDRVAALGLLANFAAMPIVSFASAPAAAASLVLSPFGLSEPAIRAFGLTLEWVLSVAHFFAGEPGGGVIPDRAMPGGALLAFSTALAGLVLFRGTLRGGAVAAGLAAGLTIWWLAPPPSLHWAPSGDVYILGADREYRRIAFIEGDGLGAMRYSDLDVSMDCARAGCDLATAGGRVRLHAENWTKGACPDNGMALHLFPEAAPAGCPGVLGWHEVRALGGQSVTLVPGGGVIRARPPSCRPRPWRPCRTKP
jgi:competence protein ComEC